MLSAVTQEIMRSFTSFQAIDMEWLFWFSLLLAYLPTTKSIRKNESCLSQPNKVIWRKNGQRVLLPCTVIPLCTDKALKYEWFTFKENSHRRLMQGPEDHQKYRLDGASLHIESLHVNDSGIYHCAAVSEDPALGIQYIGMGTTLVVKEKAKVMVRHILLWLSFVLLSIYSLALVTLIVKKYGCRRARKSDKRNSTKRKAFSDVLQEMYHKRNLEKGKQSMRANHPQAEAASADLHSSHDDIYQNV